MFNDILFFFNRCFFLNTEVGMKQAEKIKQAFLRGELITYRDLETTYEINSPSRPLKQAIKELREQFEVKERQHINVNTNATYKSWRIYEKGGN